MIVRICRFVYLYFNTTKFNVFIEKKKKFEIVTYG